MSAPIPPYSEEELVEIGALHFVGWAFEAKTDWCVRCDASWPCPTARLLATIDARAAQIKAMFREYQQKVDTLERQLRQQTERADHDGNIYIKQIAALQEKAEIAQVIIDRQDAEVDTYKTAYERVNSELIRRNGEIVDLKRNQHIYLTDVIDCKDGEIRGLNQACDILASKEGQLRDRLQQMQIDSASDADEKLRLKTALRTLRDALMAVFKLAQRQNELEHYSVPYTYKPWGEAISAICIPAAKLADEALGEENPRTVDLRIGDQGEDGGF